MESSAEADRPASTWRAWAGTTSWSPCEDAQIRICTEAWHLEGELFDGAWLIADCRDQESADVLARSVASMLVLGIVACAVRDQVRAEDLSDVVTEAADYIDELELADSDRRALLQLLSSLSPYYPELIADWLLDRAWHASASGLFGSARSFAALAYEAATTARNDASAQSAALALARVATMQECSRAARQWRGRAHVHGRRAAKVRAAAS